jgi:hypothetical protein
MQEQYPQKFLEQNAGAFAKDFCVGFCHIRSVGHFKTFTQELYTSLPADTDLAARYGCLREEFISGPSSGSGVWGREFNDKCFQVVQSMSIDAGPSSYEVAREML